MKLLGAALVLCGGMLTAFGLRQKEREKLLWLESLLNDLSILRREICVLRTPLPLLLRDLAASASAAASFWDNFLAILSGRTVAQAWEQALLRLPEDIRRSLLPVGGAISKGGCDLAAVIDETREELAGYLRAEKLRQAAQGRIETALCLSAAGLAVLVLI